jgi:hypothetical protein
LVFYEWMVATWEKIPTNSVVSAHLFIFFTFFLPGKRYWFIMTKAALYT